MRIPTILNRVEKFKSFVYGKARLEEQDDGLALVVEIWPCKNSRPDCSGCGRRGRLYDRLEHRWSEYVPLWGIMVFLVYRMRRVDCKRCEVTAEMVSWLRPGQHWPIRGSKCLAIGQRQKRIPKSAEQPL